MIALFMTKIFLDSKPLTQGVEPLDCPEMMLTPVFHLLP